MPNPDRQVSARLLLFEHDDPLVVRHVDANAFDEDLDHLRSSSGDLATGVRPERRPPAVRVIVTRRPCLLPRATTTKLDPLEIANMAVGRRRPRNDCTVLLLTARLSPGAWEARLAVDRLSAVVWCLRRAAGRAGARR